MPRSRAVLSFAVVLLASSLEVPHAASAASGTSVAAPQQSSQSARRRRPPVRRTVNVELGGERLEVSFGLPKVGDREFERLQRLEVGETLVFERAPVIKLLTEATVRIGDAELQHGNAAPDHPGLYGVWLRRATSGWELAFDEHADAWGTQYQPDAIRATTTVEHETAPDQVEVFDIALEPSGEDRAEMRIRWGKEVWTTTVRRVD